ncbi:S8 family serine peptidase [Anaeromyxobacter oryzae]|uniref:Peptidase S8/S53 domain-containing protein n=1 Tax=Anaeromyxobacter oryzae TaxID=2918170 RepID=A0ABM7WWB4_9BACT|nr:S8 family serine peptidase [Anaeromyxobacter oryzae]BDG03793.1 hypothetical protein AMOR_27890 [Anaeromyxobacter oryzae]
MLRRAFAPLAVSVALLAACGGGKSSTTTASTHRITGTVSAAAANEADWDVADPAAPSRSNDSLAQAQPLPSAVTVGGWVSNTNKAYDPVDDYRVSLAGGQRITLAVADPTGVELTLCAEDVNKARAAICAVAAVGTAILQIDVATSDEYFVEVSATTGASSYTLSIGAGPATAAVLRTDREFVPGEVVVKFRDGAPGAASTQPRTIPERARALGLAALAGAPGRPALLGLGTASERGRALAALGVASAQPGSLAAPLDAIQAEKLDTLRAVNALRARADVESADPNYVFHPTLVPDDPLYRYQWDYPLMNLPQAWDLTQGGPMSSGDPTPIVAVVDTGVFLAHPDLQGQLVDGYDFISDPLRARDGDGVDPNPDDPGDDATAGQSSFHGTHVAGTIAARTNNGLGVAGVAPGAKVMPVRALGVGGGTSFDILQGVLWAAGLDNSIHTPPPARRADVINLSLGCLGCYSQTEQDAFAAVRAAGVVVVAAAGNENSGTASYPASYAGVISVSAVDIQRAKAPYSNFGPNVDLAAPGGNSATDLNNDGKPDGIASTLADDSSGTRKPAYAIYQGTSMASPHVAGVVALMKSVCPSLTPDQLDSLVSTDQITVDLGVPGRDDVFGHGLIDAVMAVQGAQAQCGKPVAPALQVTPPRIDFVPGQTSAQLEATKTGGDVPVLSVTGVTASEAWLSVSGPSPATGNGLGTYTVTANPNGLADGVYSAHVDFAVQGGSSLSVPVTLQKGTRATGGGIGYVYILLLDSNLKPKDQRDGTSTTGQYGYAFTGVADGSYYVAAGTDMDDDGEVCDAGEACGAWPTLGAPTTVVVSGKDVDGIDFVIGFDASLGGTSPAYLLPPRALRRAAPTRTLLGGAP